MQHCYMVESRRTKENVCFHSCMHAYMCGWSAAILSETYSWVNGINPFTLSSWPNLLSLCPTHPHQCSVHALFVCLCGGTGRTHIQATAGLKEDRFAHDREKEWIPSFPGAHALPWGLLWPPLSLHCSEAVAPMPAPLWKHFTLVLREAMERSGCSLSALRNFCDVRFHVMVSWEVIAARETTEKVGHYLAWNQVLPPEKQTACYWSLVTHIDLSSATDKVLIV